MLAHCRTACQDLVVGLATFSEISSSVGLWQATLEFIMKQTNACHKIAAPALSHQCLQHMISCDSDSRVRYWLQQTQRMKHLSSDISECCDIAFWDELQASFQPTPKTSVCMCSWVCHDVQRSQSSQTPCIHTFTQLLCVRLAAVVPLCKCSYNFGKAHVLQ